MECVLLLLFLVCVGKVVEGSMRKVMGLAIYVSVLVVSKLEEYQCDG